MAISIIPTSAGQVTPSDLTGPQVNSGSQALDAPAPGEASQPPPNLPTPADQIAAHAGLVAQASQALHDVAGAASQPDLTGEGARLLALHLQQLLSGQSLSIANQAPQSLLALLR